MKYDEFGRELPDATPVELPVGFVRPPTLQEEIMRLIRNEMSQQAAEQGYETFEEADDFDEDVDWDDKDTQYEYVDMSPDEMDSRDAGKIVVDKHEEKPDNGRAPEGKGAQPKESSHGRADESRSDVERRRVEVGYAGVGADGKVGSAFGREGRSAGDGRGGVSEGRTADRRAVS